ncbi:MAG: DUF4255 domain-containing protein [Fibrobacter sp.]|nr:DUF4255 domain-containing protein [Fibrobacter sp.]
MIKAALQFLATQLNQYLRRKSHIQEDMVVVSRIMDNDGHESEHSTNKLVLFIANIEKDTIAHTSAKPEFDGFRNIMRANPIFLNLHVVLAANFKANHYEESLKYLSKAVGFFQDHSVFDRANSPELPSGLEKLILDVENLNFQEMSNLWSFLGCKYVPSIMYKVRTVALGSEYSYFRPYVIHVPEDASIGKL